MQEYDEAMKRRHEHALTHAAAEAAKSAALWGGLGSAATQLATGNRSLPNILLRGLGGAAVAAPVAGGAELLGGAILGTPPGPEEQAGYARRGALGGALGGGLLGGGLGYLLGSGRLRALGQLAPVAKAYETAKEMLPLDNMITDRVKQWASKGGHHSGLKAAGLLGLAGAGFGGATGLDEGMSVDTMHGLDHAQTEEERRHDHR